VGLVVVLGARLLLRGRIIRVFIGSFLNLGKPEAIVERV